MAWCIKPAGTAFFVTYGPVRVTQMSLLLDLCLRSYVTWALLMSVFPVGPVFRARDLNVAGSYHLMCQ